MKKTTLLILVMMVFAIAGGVLIAEQKKSNPVSLEEQLKAALNKAEKAERKTPWHCLDIVRIYLKMNKINEAFAWLEKAVERGFLSYQELDDEAYSLLKKDQRLTKIIARIKANIGIGRLARDFEVALLSGEKFQLSRQKGKVVLVDFWATWCQPCVEGVPHLLEFYRQYKGQGFEIIGFSLDNKKEDLDQYLAKQKLPWSIVFSGKGWMDDVACNYNVNLIPSYWLIDKKGVLRYFGLPLRSKETLKKAIATLLAE